MTSYEIGNMSPEKAETVKDKLEGETYLDFWVTAGVQPGPSRTVTVHSPEEVELNEMKEMIIFVLATS